MVDALFVDPATGTPYDALPVQGSVALDAATLAALETINAAVTGTVALDAGTLAALETITAIVSGAVSVTNLPATQAVTGPLTDAQLRATPVAVTDNAGSLTTDGTYDERYSGGKSAYATTVSAAGDTTLVTPAAGKRLRVVWVSAIPSPDNTAANRVRLKFGAAGAPFYETYALAHWEIFDGATNAALIVNTATAEPVSVTVHYREMT